MAARPLCRRSLQRPRPITIRDVDLFLSESGQLPKPELILAGIMRSSCRFGLANMILYGPVKLVRTEALPSIGSNHRGWGCPRGCYAGVGRLMLSEHRNLAAAKAFFQSAKGGDRRNS